MTEEDTKRYFSAVGLAVFLFTLTYFLGGFLIGFLIRSIAPWLIDHDFLYNLITLIPLYGMAFPVLLLMLRRLPKDSATIENMGVSGFFKGLCVCQFFTVAGNFISIWLLSAYQMLSRRELSNPVATITEDQSFWINLLFVAILGPVLEELVFRKILCDRLLPLGEGYAVVISAAIFALVHGNFFQIFYAFFLGLIFGLIYVKTGRIRYSIIYHGAINFLNGVVSTWVLEKIEPIMNEDAINRMLELSQQGTAESVQEMLHSFLIPMIPLLIYEAVAYGLAICGLVFFLIGYKKIRLTKGLLPPPEQGRVANVFLNGGVAAALTCFAVIFVLSLMGS
jgi:membrane protease YdiL (CAAX protease family)